MNKAEKLVNRVFKENEDESLAVRINECIKETVKVLNPVNNEDWKIPPEYVKALADRVKKETPDLNHLRKKA
jgi:hypothetical protein